MLSKSELIFMKIKAEDMEAIIDSKELQPMQKHITFRAICQDLLLLKKEDKPINLTHPIEKLFDADQTVVKEMTELGMKMQRFIQENEDYQKMLKNMKDLEEERMDNMKTFYRTFKRFTEGIEEKVPEKAPEKTPDEVEFKEEENKPEDRKRLDEVINKK